MLRSLYSVSQGTSTHTCNLCSIGSEIKASLEFDGLAQLRRHKSQGQGGETLSQRNRRGIREDDTWLLFLPQCTPMCAHTLSYVFIPHPHVNMHIHTNKLVNTSGKQQRLLLFLDSLGYCQARNNFTSVHACMFSGLFDHSGG